MNKSIFLLVAVFIFFGWSAQAGEWLQETTKDPTSYKNTHENNTTITHTHTTFPKELGTYLKTNPFESILTILEFKDSSVYKNPVLLFLISNARVKDALDLIKFINLNNFNIKLHEFDALNLNNALMLAIAKGSDYFYNRYRLPYSSKSDEEHRMEYIINELIELSSAEDLNLQNSQGNTALHLAFLTRDFSIIRMLIDAGAQLDIKNNCSEEPIAMLKYNYLLSSAYIRQQVGGGPFFFFPTYNNFEEYNAEIKQYIGENFNF